MGNERKIRGKVRVRRRLYVRKPEADEDLLAMR